MDCDPDASHTDETVRCLSDAGYGYACTTVADLAWPGMDHYRLPGLLVRDWDLDIFECKPDAGSPDPDPCPSPEMSCDAFLW